MTVANTLAYYATVTIMTIIFNTAQAPREIMPAKALCYFSKQRQLQLSAKLGCLFEYKSNNLFVKLSLFQKVPVCHCLLRLGEAMVPIIFKTFCFF